MVSTALSTRDASASMTSIPARLARFRRVDDARSAMAIAVDWATIALAALVAVRLRAVWADALAAVVIGGRQVALTNLLHTAAHGSLFARKRWNERLEVLYGLPLLDSVRAYRGPHLEHHDEIANLHPNRLAYLHNEIGLPRRGPLGRIWVLVVKPLLGGGLVTVVRALVASCGRDPALPWKLLMLWVPATAFAAVLGPAALLGLARYWLLPLVTTYPLFLLWGEVADHFGAASGTRNHVGLFHAFLINGHALYHDVHHRYPFLPFYQEHAALALLGDEGCAMEEMRGPLAFIRVAFGPPMPA
jgi:fatty acid desaturase